MSSESSRLVPVPDLIERLGVSRTKVYELIRDGEVEAVKIGRRTLVTEASISGFVASLPRVQF